MSSSHVPLSRIDGALHGALQALQALHDALQALHDALHDSYLGFLLGMSTWRVQHPPGGHHNRDQALAYNCPLDSLIKRSKLPLKTFTSADRMTASGRSFQRSTTLDVKLYFDISP